MAPSASTRNDLVNVLCDFCSVAETILKNVYNPEQAAHVWTAMMLEFSVVPEILQMAKCLSVFQEAIEEVMHAVIKMAGTCNWVRAN